MAANFLENLAGKMQSDEATDLKHLGRFLFDYHQSGYYSHQSLVAFSTLTLSLFQLSMVYSLNFHRAAFTVFCCEHQLYFSTWR